MSADIDQVIGESPLFKHLDSSWHSRLKAAGQVEQFSAGETIIAEGSQASRLFILISGRVRVWTSAGGRAVELKTLNPGGYFGEVSVLSGKQTTASVAAESGSVETFSIGRQILLELVSEDEKVRDMLEGVTLARARDTISKVLK